MAINVYGVTGSITDKDWSQLLQDLGDMGAGMGLPLVPSVTVQSGLSLTVSAFRSLQAGTNLTMDASQTVTAATRDATNPRYSLVCAQVDWVAATTAYTAAINAGQSVAQAGAAASAAGGSLVVVNGSAAASPSWPNLIQIRGVKWQTPVKQVLVPATGSLTITDVGLPGTPPVGLTLPGNFTTDTTWPLQVIRSGPSVFLSGRMTRSSTILGAGTSMNFNGAAIIPPGFRPLRQVQVTCSSGAADMHWLMVNTDGTAQFTAGPTIAISAPVRIHDAYWKAA